MFRSISEAPLFAIAIIVLAVAALGTNNLVTGASSNDDTTASQKSFGPIKQINAGLLNVGYASRPASDLTATRGIFASEIVKRGRYPEHKCLSKREAQ
jgi:hypothetical protein